MRRCPTADRTELGPGEEPTRRPAGLYRAVPPFISGRSWDIDDDLSFASEFHQRQHTLEVDRSIKKADSEE